MQWDALPIIPTALGLAQAGVHTGASTRNWAGYGQEVQLPDGFSMPDRALLTDPQTSGGLLVSCAPQALDEVMALFSRHGFGAAAVVGHIGQQQQRAGRLLVEQ